MIDFYGLVENKDSMDAKCTAAKVDPGVARQLLASLDYDVLRKEGKSSTLLMVGDASVTLELGMDYFLDAREALRKCGVEEMRWAF